MPLSKILKEGKECSKQKKFPEGRRVHTAEPTAKVLGREPWLMYLQNLKQPKGAGAE